MSTRTARWIIVTISVVAIGWAASAGAQTHDHGAYEEPAPSDPREGTPPPVTDEERAAAFPDVQGHTVHDNMLNYYVLFDQLEWQTGGESGARWDNKGWIGRDKDRFWFRSELDEDDGRVADAEVHLMYGRAFSRWWEVVAGVRQDFRPGPAQTWAALGLQGLAPYWFEVEATAYIGAGGQTALRLETEYELLLTNRLILQPLVELNLYGKDNVERGIGAGLSTAETGLRVRYEIRREIAPYVGVTWQRKLGKTADFAEAAGEDTGGARLAVGARIWF